MNVHRVLVLDDDIGVCTVLSRILAEHYDVHTSQSVGGVADTLVEKSFDAYLLDYRLPDGTGLQVAEKVRQQGITAPIILISGYGASDIAAKATTLGISDVLQKPFTRETICSALDRALTQPLPVAVPHEPVDVATPEPAFRVRLGTLQILLITVALLFVFLCIFLMFR